MRTQEEKEAMSQATGRQLQVIEDMARERGVDPPAVQTYEQADIAIQELRRMRPVRSRVAYDDATQQRIEALERRTDALEAALRRWTAPERP
jgi:hypothetical protein